MIGSRRAPEAQMRQLERWGLFRKGEEHRCATVLYGAGDIRVEQVPPDEGGQAEAVRVPLADGTLVKLPVTPDSALMPSLLTLADVLGRDDLDTAVGHLDGTGPWPRRPVCPEDRPAPPGCSRY
jgi:hypothetical protein